MNTRRGAEEANRESSAAGQSRDLHEMKDRLRRMETRLVTLCTNLGYETVRKLPKWRINDLGPEVDVPSEQVSLVDIMTTIRENTTDDDLGVRIVHKGKLLCTVVT